jgi:hypothetical protein
VSSELPNRDRGESARKSHEAEEAEWQRAATAGKGATGRKLGSRFLRGTLFALLFAVVGSLALALIAPLVLHDVDLRKVGQIIAIVMLFVGAPAGFLYGVLTGKK